MSKRKKKNKTKPVEERSRQANWKKIQVATGYCPACGSERLDINRRTGQPYSYGPVCRKKQNERMKFIMRERRRGERPS